MRVPVRIIVIVLFVSMILVGINSYLSIAHAYDSYGWNTTTGVVTTSYMFNNTNGGSPNYIFAYSYTLNNITYKSENIVVPPSIVVTVIVSENFVNSYPFIQDHPVGSSITVYYNPANPSDSAIMNGFTTVQYFDIIFLIVELFSLGISLITFSKNPLYPQAESVPERIIITQFSNILLLGGASLLIITILFCYTIIIALSDALAFILVALLMIYLKFIQQSLFLPNEFLLGSIIVLFLISFVKFIFICKNTVFSISVKKNEKAEYKINNRNVGVDPETGKWLLTVSGSYNSSSDFKYFNHTVKKNFRNKDKAEKFFNKNISPDLPDESDSNNKLNSLRSLRGKKALYIVKNKQSLEAGEVLYYQVHGISFLFLIPVFFVDYLYAVITFFTIQSASMDVIIKNIFNNSYFSSNSTISTNIYFLVVLALLVIIEGIVFIYQIFSAFQWFIIKIYKRFLWTKEDQDDERQSNDLMVDNENF